jgi:peptidoglycan/LPS O-acetylase OafA/YrhL
LRPRDHHVVDRSQLRSLTGLRFVAALQVLIFHCVPWASWGFPPLVRSIAGSGYVAVSLFFILSGFILTYAHCGGGARPLDRNRFYVSRFARVYPPYVFALALIAPFFVVHTIRIRGVVEFFKEAISVLTLVQAWFPSLAMAWNPPGWSLSAEAFFYILFPFVAPALVASRRSTAFAVGIGCYAFSLAVPLAYIRLAPDGPVILNHDSTASWLSVVRYNPAIRFPEFVIGVVFARFYFEARTHRFYRAGAALCSLLSVCVILATLTHAEAIPYVVLHNGLLAPVFAVLIVSLAAGRGPLSAFLATRPLVALGDASYSLYVLQVPLLILWSQVVGRVASGQFWGSGACTAALLALAVVASLLCHRYVERPLRDLALRRWAPRVRPVDSSDSLGTKSAPLL